MFDKTYLIYIGIGAVVVTVAFFAYQELQKHKMEIQKLRYESQKLQKIIHAYNMKQWHQDPSEELVETDSEEDSDADVTDEAPELTSSVAVSHHAQEILNETLSNLASKNSPPKTPQNPKDQPKKIPAQISIPPKPIQQPIAATTRTVLGGGSINVQASVQRIQQARQMDEIDDLPEVDSFSTYGTEISEPKQSPGQTMDDLDYDCAPEPDSNIVFDEADAPPLVNEINDQVDFENFQETKVDDTKVDDTDDQNDGSNSNTDEICSGTLKNGNPCKSKAKVAGQCLRHYRQSTATDNN